jgi:DNA-binding response OmpR family regulator
VASVLIVEDDSATCLLLKIVLEAEGYSIDIVRSGESALSLFQIRSFDVVVSDIKLSGLLDGISLLRMLKQQRENIEGILVTGLSRDEASERLTLLPNDCQVLYKPVDVRELATVIKRMIPIHRGDMKVSDHFSQSRSVS